MILGQQPNANSIVKAIVHQQLVNLDRWLAGHEDTGFSEVYRAQIDRYFDNPLGVQLSKAKRLPDGSPIGSYSCDF